MFMGYLQISGYYKANIIVFQESHLYLIDWLLYLSKANNFHVELLRIFLYTFEINIFYLIIYTSKYFNIIISFENKYYICVIKQQFSRFIPYQLLLHETIIERSLDISCQGYGGQTVFTDVSSPEMDSGEYYVQDRISQNLSDVVQQFYTYSKAQIGDPKQACFGSNKGVLVFGLHKHNYQQLKFIITGLSFLVIPIKYERYQNKRNHKSKDQPFQLKQNFHIIIIKIYILSQQILNIRVKRRLMRNLQNKQIYFPKQIQ
ncbi:hypothetical protein pb186bvf_005228 [Paramecium bursaria]